MAARCDILSVHLALKPETKGLVDAALLARLKPGAMVINTSRGELVDSEALAAAVQEKGLRVGLDVFGAEPATATGEMNDPIAGLPGVYGTHHIGASTMQAQEAIAAETVRIVRTYMETGKVPNVVNLARKTPASHMLVVRHRDRPGVLAHVFEHLRAGEPERPGDREHRLRGRRGRRGAHQPRPRARARAPRRDPRRQRRRDRPATDRALMDRA